MSFDVNCNESFKTRLPNIRLFSCLFLPSETSTSFPPTLYLLEVNVPDFVRLDAEVAKGDLL